MRHSWVLIGVALLLTSCGLSFSDTAAEQEPMRFPDYTDITLPVNIAPLNFSVEGADALRLEIEGRASHLFKANGSEMRFPMKRWKQLMAAEAGDTLRLSLSARFGKETVRYAPFHWVVSADSIDRYMSYRLIEPAYEVWNVLSVEERDLESFRTRLLADNTRTEGSCINCHTANRGGQSQVSFMHVRGKKGGTLYSRD